MTTYEHFRRVSHLVLRAIEAGIRALEEATRSVTSIGLCDETKIQRNQVAKAFLDAEQANKNCFKAFKVKSTHSQIIVFPVSINQLSWDNRKSIGEAAKEDEERVRQTNARLKYVSRVAVWYFVNAFDCVLQELKRRRYPQADREFSVVIMKDDHVLDEHIGRVFLDFRRACPF